MKGEKTDPVDGVDRRSVLAAGAAGLSLSLSGCIDSVRSAVTDIGDDQLSLSILTVPADGDTASMRIATHLEENLQAVGIDANLRVRSRTDFLEAILIDHDFDLYVGRHPADYDPDFLYEALHSTYAGESGWQNPFGFEQWTFDRFLEEQRRADADDRPENIASLLTALAEEKPFDPICRPNEVRVARSDRFDGWDDGHLATRRGYLGLEPTDEDTDRLTALVTDTRPSRNVNPLSATVRERGTVVDLLYDSLGTVVDGEVKPWLAESWEWEREVEDDQTTETTATATVTLREDCTFHATEEYDEEPVTAHDVAFTYRFLEDTALGQATAQSPAPRYRGHISAVEAVEVEDDYQLSITVNASEAVGERAFTVPILPRHVWRAEIEDRIDNLEDFSAPQGRWGVVSSSSIPPIGSGPYQFESQSERSYLALERFDDHFTRREDVDDEHLLEPLVEELRFAIDPGSRSSIARVESGAADVTSSMLEANTLAEIPEDDPNVERMRSDSWTFYHVGFNTRSQPYNLHFRRAVSQLLDKEWIAEEIFYDNATPVATPVADDWVPDTLEWDGEDPVTPFVGTDGTVNVEAARPAFQKAGLEYDDDGRLLERD